MSFIQIKCKVITLNVYGIAETYIQKITIEDEAETDGFRYEYVSKSYNKPKIAVEFLGEVDIELEINATYYDGVNPFRALSKNKIKNINEHVDRFYLPTKLILISKSFNELKS